MCGVPMMMHCDVVHDLMICVVVHAIFAAVGAQNVKQIWHKSCGTRKHICQTHNKTMYVQRRARFLQ